MPNLRPNLPLFFVSPTIPSGRPQETRGLENRFLRSFLLLLILALVLPSQATAQANPAASGFVRVEQIDGTWWFISPEGEPFVSVGVNHVEPHLWLAPYNKATTLERYGADLVDDNGHFDTHSTAAGKWIDRQVEIVEGLHFNTFGVHTHPAIDPALYRDQVYHLARLNTAPLAGWRERNGEGPRPDVFSEDFRRFVEQRVKDVTAQHKNSHKLLGYLYTDIPSWVMGKADQKPLGKTVMIYPWVNAILPLGEASPGKQRWLELLKERYDSPAAAAETWGLRISPTYGITWADMARRVDWTNPADSEKADADMRAFLHLIADQWYRLHRRLLLQHDPNHLIFGDKQMINLTHPWVIEALKQHVDAICVQTYGRWADDGPVMEQLYAATGKPIFNGDGCFSFAQPEQQEWGVKGFRTGARSVAEVAEFYRETLELMMADPHLIGWHHCGYLQQWDQAERGDSPRNENGFLDPFETPYEEWTTVIREVNARAAKLHQNAQP